MSITSRQFWSARLSHIYCVVIEYPSSKTATKPLAGFMANSDNPALLSYILVRRKEPHYMKVPLVSLELSVYDIHTPIISCSASQVSVVLSSISLVFAWSRSSCLEIVLLCIMLFFQIVMGPWASNVNIAQYAQYALFILIHPYSIAGIVKIQLIFPWLIKLELAFANMGLNSQFLHKFFSSTDSTLIIAAILAFNLAWRGVRVTAWPWAHRWTGPPSGLEPMWDVLVLESSWRVVQQSTLF